MRKIKALAQNSGSVGTSSSENRGGNPIKKSPFRWLIGCPAQWNLTFSAGHPQLTQSSELRTPMLREVRLHMFHRLNQCHPEWTLSLCFWLVGHTVPYI
jgi:hypothetical protein